MPALDSALRRNLENTIISARDAAERAAGAAIKALAVGEREPYASLTPDERALRNRLRAKARQLGGGSLEAGLGPLAAECAYEQWHRMLFARFLAENNLLMHPEGVPVTLEECAEQAQEEGDPDAWATAARYASLMLPGIFGGEEPTLEVRLAPEGRRALERLLQEIPPPTFTADDGLGWVYQFWQTKAKKEVNASGRKIEGADLPAVTQLFTEDYMVKFLLHNTLGAWWAARHPESQILADLEYLRRKEDGDPAAGTFDGWPGTAASLTVMDPCCGSGHFLTAAADLLTRMRAEEEGLSEADAADAVLRDNLFGLELDARCAQIAAFALALQAWKRGGYRELPIPNVACSGLAVGGRVEEWTRLARGDLRLENALRRLHAMFRDAPDLGSLIDPARVAEGRAFARTGTTEMDVAGMDEVEDLLNRALDRDRGPAGDDPASAVFGEAARGIARAASFMRRRYTLVATNVPYLARGKQGETLKGHLETYYPQGKADLATAFVERCSAYAEGGGTYALVTSQNWLFLGTYKKLRERLLKTQSWGLVARLGPKGFQTPMWDFNVMLISFTNALPTGDHPMTGLDVSDRKTPAEKDYALRKTKTVTLLQSGQLNNPDARLSLGAGEGLSLLARFADGYAGLQSGDYARYGRCFWELQNPGSNWNFQQSTFGSTSSYDGREHILYWESGKGDLAQSAGAYIRGVSAWHKDGIAVSQMNALPCTLYTGDLFDNNTAVITPKNEKHLPAIWAYLSSPAFNDEVRKIDQKINVTNATLVKIPFDLERWQRVADEQYPDGLPEPYSDDPTQWLFHGHPARAIGGTALQVAVARLLGYRWPAESDNEMDLSAEARTWISRCPALDPFTDPDGIVCLPPVAGERPAAERLRALLAKAFGERWSQPLLDRLLSKAGSPGKDLNAWLRDDFFKQHCRLFHNRPFIWHVWDGRKDGFSALVNYHRLDSTLLRRLIYTYLGSYIEAQSTAARSGVTGADLRLSAVQDLKSKLEAILHGEDPYDIYVRWKPLAEQPVGWEPDLNDGVRLNVRPFVEAGVLRSRFTIHWKKDRGRNPDGSERHNDLHLTRAEKEEARRKGEATRSAV